MSLTAFFYLVKLQKLWVNMMPINTFTRLLLFALLLTLASQAVAQATRTPVAHDFTAMEECGVALTSELAKRPRTLKTCGSTTSSFAWTATAAEAAALAGHRLYVEADLRLEGRVERTPPRIFLLITAFKDREVASHVGGNFMFAGGTLIGSAYIPYDSTRVTITIQPNGAQLPFTLGQTRVTQSDKKFMPNQMCEACKAKLDAAFERIEGKYLYSEKLTIGALRRTAYLSATGADIADDVDISIKETLRLINDAHSRYLTRGEVALLTAPFQQAAIRDAAANPPPATVTPSRVDLNSTAPQSQAAGAAGAEEAAESLSADHFVTGKMIETGIGYLRISGFGGATYSLRRRYAVHIRDQLLALEREGAVSWVIDLRDHGGGSTPPLIAALRPLLGAGSVGYDVGAGGKRMPWLYGDASEAAIGNEIYFPIKIPGTPSSPYIGFASAPVAILIGAQTASAAETLVVAFKARSNTKSFGSPTAGYTTSVFDLPDADGSILAVTSGALADRNGIIYRGMLTPDESSLAINSKANPNDATTKLAVNWLNSLSQLNAGSGKLNRAN